MVAFEPLTVSVVHRRAGAADGETGAGRGIDGEAGAGNRLARPELANPVARRRCDQIVRAVYGQV